MRRQFLLGDRFGDRDKRHQGQFGAHVETFALCTSKKLAGSRSNGSVPSTGAKPAKAGPMELAMRAATSASTGTPATSVIALISFAVGVVMPGLLPCWFLYWFFGPVRGCAPSLEWPCSTPLRGPLY